MKLKQRVYLFLSISNIFCFSYADLDNVTQIILTKMAQRVCLEDHNYILNMILNSDIEIQNFFRKKLIAQNLEALHSIFKKNICTEIDHQYSLTCAAISKDAKFILTGGVAPSAFLWNLEQLPPNLETLNNSHTLGITSAAFSSDGKFALIGSWHKIATLWNLQKHPYAFCTLEAHNDVVWAVALSNDGQYALTGSRDHTAMLWNLQKLNDKKYVPICLKGHENWVVAVAFSPDGKFILTGSYDYTIRLWEISQLTEVDYTPIILNCESCVNAAVFSPDGSRVLVALADNTLLLWNLNRISEIDYEPRALYGHAGWVHSATFSSDGNFALSGSYDNTARLWDLLTDPPTSQVLNGHSSAVNCVAFAPDGKFAATTSNDITLCLWDLNFSYLSLAQIFFAISIYNLKKKNRRYANIFNDSRFLEAIEDVNYLSEIATFLHNHNYDKKNNFLPGTNFLR